MPGSGKTSARIPNALAHSCGDSKVLPVFERIVGVDPSDPEGLIPLAVSLSPLECRIPQWVPGPGAGRTHTLRLWWRVRGVEVLAD